MVKILDRTKLKYIAIIAMVIDHFAILLIPRDPSLYTVYKICRFIGKLTAPLMCYFLVEGFNHTSSKFKYGMRLFVFAIISQFAFSLAFFNKIFTFNFNMIFTLFLCFLVLLFYEKIKSKVLKWGVILFLIVISNFSDWGIYAPVWVICFHIYKGNLSKQLVSYYLSTILVIILKSIVIDNVSWNSILIYMGLFLFVPIISLYNGKKGSNNKFDKWFFYMFYPLHLIIFYFV